MEKGLITREDYERITELLKSYGLLPGHDIPDGQVSQLLMKDKKKSGNDIFFVFLNGIGNAVAEKIAVNEAVDFYIHNKPANNRYDMNSFGRVFRSRFLANRTAVQSVWLSMDALRV
jgi:hypothetical protein